MPDPYGAPILIAGVTVPDTRAFAVFAVTATDSSKPVPRVAGDHMYCKDTGNLYASKDGSTWTQLNGSSSAPAGTGVVSVTNGSFDSPHTVSAAGYSFLAAADAGAQRTALGLGSLATQSGTFSGSSSGTNTGDQASVSGNAGTATALQTPRTINGTSFDGTTNITVSAAPNGSASGDLAGSYPGPTIKASVSLTTPVIGVATGTSLALTGALTSSGGGIGYAAGAGGAVAQATNKSTGVTLSKLCGTITMNAAALAAAAIVSFTVTNTTVLAGDIILIQHESGGTLGAYTVLANTVVGATSFKVTVRNNSAGSLSEALVLKFAVYRAVAA